MKDGVKNEEQMSKKPYGKIALVIILIAVVIFGVILIARSCDDSGKTALEFRDGNDNVTASIDQQLLSLMIADIKFQYGWGDMPEEFWQTENGFFGNMILTEAVANAGRFLRSEYYADYVEGTGISVSQKKMIDDCIAYWVKFYGSESAFETYLSTYGTSIEALKRYMELGIKQNNLKRFMYLDNPETKISDNQVIEFFEKDYNVADFIFISLISGTKENGDPIPLTGAAKESQLQKKTLAEMELNSGADFEEVMKKYSDAPYEEYKKQYPNGVFIPRDGTAEGLDPAVGMAVTSMAPESTQTVETSRGIFIVKKHVTDADILKNDPEYFERLRIMLSNADFDALLDSDEGIRRYKEIINELSPSSIPALDVNSLISASQQ